MHVEEAVAAAHVGAAVSALAAGALVLALRKGTAAHRTGGFVYVLLLLLLNVAALSLHRESAFGVFHVLAVISLATLAFGVVPLLSGSRSPIVVAVHAYCMTWSYAGLVAAGLGQLTVTLGPDGGGWEVPAVIGVTLGLSSAVIFSRVPRVLDRGPRQERSSPTGQAVPGHHS